MRKITLSVFMALLLCGCTVQPERLLAEPPPSVAQPSIAPSPLPAVSVPPEPSPEVPPPEEPSEAPEPIRATIQFAGDIILHTSPIRGAETGRDTYDFKPFFEAVAPYINGDLALCNMESPVDVFGNNQNISTYPRFNAPYEILEALKHAGFNHLLNGNNHVFDKGMSGLEATLRNFDKAGFASDGARADGESFQKPTVLDVNGIQVGLLSYTESVNGLDSLATEEQSAYAVRRFSTEHTEDIPRMSEDIATLRSAGAELVVVSLHWGAEYHDAPTEIQREIAESLCDAGADVILGGHSHCVQPIEWYNRDGARCLIMYSLGNFFADQTALENPIGKTQYGALVTLSVSKSPDGDITLDGCTALPTLCCRDKSGTLGVTHSILPLSGGSESVPAFVTDEGNRAWGRRAFEHVLKIIGGGFVRGTDLLDT
ncbi:MAG: CapA family protein [Oscillospiraceae bacterium]|jgi:poly-gamma-glutamate synthesis protein (capsule biosynthesis protein)|nr:CapA family protein [Oscillospiraceae bacterium]